MRAPSSEVREALARIVKAPLEIPRHEWPPAEQPCQGGCGGTFSRREGEKLSDYLDRQSCDRPECRRAIRARCARDAYHWRRTLGG